MIFVGQQVTGYGHADENNWWQIIPTKAIPENGRGRIVRHSDVIQLLHVSTDTYLLTHDVASPLMPTNQEFTTWPRDDISRYNDTLFHLYLTGGHEGESFGSEVSLDVLIDAFADQFVVERRIGTIQAGLADGEGSESGEIDGTV